MQRPDRLAQVISEAAGVHRPRPSLTIEKAVAFLNVGTTAEYAELLGMSRPQTAVALKAAGLRAHELPGGAAWTP